MRVGLCAALAATIVASSGCAELHQRRGMFTATGVSANILFMQIPRDPLDLASAKVPAGATVTNVTASPNDWRTMPGFFHRLLGKGWAQIGGIIDWRE